MSSPLFDESFLKKLYTIGLIVKKQILNKSAGEKSAFRRGGKIEFSDYRNYSFGDDIKQVDWNVFGKTEKLFIKEFDKEESTTVYLVLDLTLSMSLSNEINSKANLAKKLVVALGYVSLLAGHKLNLITLSGQEVKSFPKFRRANDIFNVMRFLEAAKPDGATEHEVIIREMRRKIKEKGIIVFISDLMIQKSGTGDFNDIKKGFLVFKKSNFEINIIQLLSSADMNAKAKGRLKLVDSETGEIKNVFVDETVSDEYMKEVNKFVEDWKSFCIAHGMHFFYITADTPLEEAMMKIIRQGVLLK